MRSVLAAMFSALLVASACARGQRAPTPSTAPPARCEAWTSSTFTAPAGLVHRDRYGMGESAAPPWSPPSAGWRLPDDVSLDVALARQSPTELVLRATLANTARAPRVVYLLTPRLGVSATLLGDGVSVLPPTAPQAGETPPPPSFPEETLYVLPAGARWVFDAAVDLRCWRHPPNARAELVWTFSLAGSGRQGRLPLTLP